MIPPREQLIAMARSAYRHPREGDDDAPLPRPPIIFPGRISICINTSDEGPRLRGTIDDFRANLEGNDVEFVVVADGVTDGCCDGLGDDVRVLRNATPVGCTRAKRQAVEATTGDILIFCDAHHMVTRGWLARLAVEAAKSRCIVCPVAQNIVYDAQVRPGLKSTDVVFPRRKGYLLTNGLYQSARRVACGITPIDAVYCVTAMSRDTLDALGGWPAYKGRHGWQEYALSLRALGAGLRIKLAGCVWVGHEWREKMPYPSPMLSENRRNLWHCFRTLFSDEAFFEHVEPYLVKHDPRGRGRDAIDDPDVLAERDHYLEHCRKLTDRQLLEACEIHRDITISTQIPFLPDRRLGEAYNAIMSRAGPDEWVLLLDHDVLLLAPRWYEQCHRAIDAHGASAGIITCVTNRIGCPHQRARNAPKGDDIAEHAHFAQALYAASANHITKLPNDRLVSGFFMLTSKRAWQAARGFCDGFLGVDNDYHRRVLGAGLKVYRIDGLYCYHQKITTGGPPAMT